MVKGSEKQVAEQGGKRQRAWPPLGVMLAPSCETARLGSCYTDTCPWSITLLKSRFSWHLSVFLYLLKHCYLVSFFLFTENVFFFVTIAPVLNKAAANRTHLMSQIHNLESLDILTNLSVMKTEFLVWLMPRFPCRPYMRNSISTACLCWLL